MMIMAETKISDNRKGNITENNRRNAKIRKIYWKWIESMKSR